MFALGRKRTLAPILLSLTLGILLREGAFTRDAMSYSDGMDEGLPHEENQWGGRHPLGNAFLNMPSQRVTLINKIETFRWSPPSPDPMGITFDSFTGRFIVSDSEVEEAPQPYWHGVNLWEMTAGGSVLAPFTTFTKNPATGVWNNYSNEPTGLAFNPTNGHLFVSDDDAEKIFEIDPGPDGTPGTVDDRVTFFSTSAFGDGDTEDVAYAGGQLYITDGMHTRIYVVDPSANGIFDGIPPVGDDTVVSCDLGALGVRDAEGVAYNPVTDHLLVVDRFRSLVEITRDADFVHAYDLSILTSSNSLQGATVAPSSINPSVDSVYIVDSQVDNNDDPSENDGVIYEISLGNPPPAVTLTPTRTRTPLSTTTSTPIATATPRANRVGSSIFLPLVIR